MEWPSKKELLKMPVRPWNDDSRLYEQILLVPTGKKHDSGYMHIAVVGVWAEGKETRYEIAAYPDDISCLFPLVQAREFQFSIVRMDCLYPSGILRYHASGRGYFKVGLAVSSVDIEYINPPQQH